MIRVLVVDDDPMLVDVVGRYLQRDGFEVLTASDGRVAVDVALSELPDLIVLDLMLPGSDGFEVFRRIREAAPIPVVMLTAMGEVDDRVAGLELGADDYLTKPFSPRELTARIHAVLRRANAPVQGHGQRVVAGGIEVDPVSHTVRRGSEELLLTSKEFDLLRHFVSNPDRAFSAPTLGFGPAEVAFGGAEGQ